MNYNRWGGGENAKFWDLKAFGQNQAPLFFITSAQKVCIIVKCRVKKGGREFGAIF